MAEGDDGEASPSNEKPFFAIDEDKSTGASSPPPTSLFMGSLDPSVSTPPSSPPTQLTGDVSVLSGAQTFTLPHVAPKQGMQWGQYFLGLFIPYGIVIVMIFILGFSESDWDDNWRYETISVTSEDNSTFEFSLEPREDEYIDGIYYYGDTLDASIDISINAWGEVTSRTDVYQYNYSSGEETVIGYYDPTNRTVFFQLDNVTTEWMNFEISYVDQDWYNGEDGNLLAEVIEGMFCTLPFIYVGAIIASFVKGKKSLGYGLLTALPLSIVLGPALFFILLLIAFGGL